MSKKQGEDYFKLQMAIGKWQIAELRFVFCALHFAFCV
jgi:hypothetical protein